MDDMPLILFPFELRVMSLLLLEYGRHRSARVVDLSEKELRTNAVGTDFFFVNHWSFLIMLMYCLFWLMHLQVQRTQHLSFVSREQAASPRRKRLFCTTFSFWKHKPARIPTYCEKTPRTVVWPCYSGIDEISANEEQVHTELRYHLQARLTVLTTEAQSLNKKQ